MAGPPGTTLFNFCLLDEVFVSLLLEQYPRCIANSGRSGLVFKCYITNLSADVRSDCEDVCTLFLPHVTKHKNYALVKNALDIKNGVFVDVTRRTHKK